MLPWPSLTPEEWREKLAAVKKSKKRKDLDKDEHGYGSYPRSERGAHATTVHGAGKSVQLPGRYDKTKIPKDSLAVTSANGYILVTKSPNEPEYLWVNHVRVADKAQGKGEGSALYKAALTAAHAKGFKGILKGKTIGRDVSSAARRVWDSFERQGLTEKIRAKTAEGEEYDSVVLVRTDPEKRTDLAYQDEEGKFESEAAAVSGGDLAVDAVIQTAVMDSNTCEECAAVDGEVMELGDERQQELDPPYVKCLGGDRCRCVQVALLSNGSQIDVDEIDEDTIE